MKADEIFLKMVYSVINKKGGQDVKGVRERVNCKEHPKREEDH